VSEEECERVVVVVLDVYEILDLCRTVALFLSGPRLSSLETPIIALALKRRCWRFLLLLKDTLLFFVPRRGGGEWEDVVASCLFLLFVCLADERNRLHFDFLFPSTHPPLLSLALAEGV